MMSSSVLPTVAQPPPMPEVLTEGVPFAEVQSFFARHAPTVRISSNREAFILNAPATPPVPSTAIDEYVRQTSGTVYGRNTNVVLCRAMPHYTVLAEAEVGRLCAEATPDRPLVVRLHQDLCGSLIRAYWSEDRARWRLTTTRSVNAWRTYWTDERAPLARQFTQCIIHEHARFVDESPRVILGRFFDGLDRASSHYFVYQHPGNDMIVPLAPADILMRYQSLGAHDLETGITYDPPGLPCQEFTLPADETAFRAALTCVTQGPAVVEGMHVRGAVVRVYDTGRRYITSVGVNSDAFARLRGLRGRGETPALSWLWHLSLDRRADADTLAAEYGAVWGPVLGRLRSALDRYVDAMHAVVVDRADPGMLRPFLEAPMQHIGRRVDEPRVIQAGVKAWGARGFLDMLSRFLQDELARVAAHAYYQQLVSSTLEIEPKARGHPRRRPRHGDRGARVSDVQGRCILPSDDRQ